MIKRGFRLSFAIQEVGWTHMRVLEGVGTLVQLAGLVARLCKMVRIPDLSFIVIHETFGDFSEYEARTIQDITIKSTETFQNVL